MTGHGLSNGYTFHFHFFGVFRIRLSINGNFFGYNEFCEQNVVDCEQNAKTIHLKWNKYVW